MLHPPVLRGAVGSSSLKELETPFHHKASCHVERVWVLGEEIGQEMCQKLLKNFPSAVFQFGNREMGTFIPEEIFWTLISPFGRLFPAGIC